MTDSNVCRGFQRREIVPDFLDQDEARSLRAEFDARVGPDRTAKRGRFVWDYWHVPDQYTYLRTGPRGFFDAARYSRLLAALRAWGQEHLGCGQTSEPWLSYYVDGCGQELHTDVVQGPFAFVYSLTHWEGRPFRGGETLLMRPELLDFWRHHEPSRSRERDELIERVPAQFNQLLVFDARIPHGAAMVEGTRDPLASRIAVHGWFLPPRIVVTGALRMTAVQNPVADAQAAWSAGLSSESRMTGSAVVRAEVGPGGEVDEATLLVSTLVCRTGQDEFARAAAAAARAAISSLVLPAADGPSTLTVPFSPASH